MRRENPFFLVSKQDRDLCEKKWHVKCDGYIARGAFVPKTATKKKGTRTVLMHREILERMLGRPMAEGEVTDHINRIRHDNRRRNLRVVTTQINMLNKGMYKNNSTGFRGVELRPGGKFRARIRFGGKAVSLGDFRDPARAAEVVRKKRSELGFLT